MTLLLALLLAAEPEPEETEKDVYTRRWTASLTGAARSFGLRTEVGFTGSFEMGFEPVPFLRIFNFGTDSPTVPNTGMRGTGPRILIGFEGIISPLLPLELAVGIAAGVASISQCGAFDCIRSVVGTGHVRVFAGYRVLRWLTLGVLASWNGYLTFPEPSWLEVGPRVSVRW